MDIEIDLTQTVLETDRLILRAWKQSDVKDFYDYASVKGVGEMAGWKPHDTIETSAIILDSFMKEKNVLAIVDKQSQKVIGSLGLHVSWANEEERYQNLKSKEVGYVLSKDYWGHGLMPEAVNALIAYAFDQLNLDLLTCCHFTHNDQSKRVIEKCGFQYQKDGRFYIEYLDQMVDDKKYILWKDK